MGQLPKICTRIGILSIEYFIILWARSFSTRLTSVTFAEDKVLIFLNLRKNAKIVQLLSLTLISRADWSDKLEWYIVERYIGFLKIWFNKRTHPNERRNGQKPPCCHSRRHSWRGTKWAETVAETNQLSERGHVLVPGCAVHILENWLTRFYIFWRKKLCLRWRQLTSTWQADNNYDLYRLGQKLDHFLKCIWWRRKVSNTSKCSALSQE